MTKTPYNSVNDDRFSHLILWLKECGVSSDSIVPASSDAGFRRYFRVNLQGRSLIAVDAPPEHENTARFVKIAERLRESGINTPKVHRYSLENGFMLLEDFGNSHLQSVVTEAESNSVGVDGLYQRAIEALIKFQQNAGVQDLPLYDHDFLKRELNLFSEWYLRRHLGINPSPDQQHIIEQTFNELTDSALEQPTVFVHRDYHSRNLMLTPHNKIGVIDFQDAVAGPLTYDSVSLLRDAYLEWPNDFQHCFMEQHRNALIPIPDQATYKRWFDLMGLQRHLKILGIFCRLHYRDNKSHYLDDLPLVCRHISRTLAAYPDLQAFSTFFHSLNVTSSTT